MDVLKGMGGHLGDKLKSKGCYIIYKLKASLPNTRD